MSLAAFKTARLFAFWSAAFVNFQAVEPNESGQNKGT
jgi:hypothetical protein